MSQHAALAALTRTDESRAAVAEMVRAFHERRDAALAVLAADPTLPVVPPEGAFYLYVDASGRAPAGEAAGTWLAQRLLDDHDVAGVPGDAFGTPDWLRLSYAAPIERVVEGMRRLLVAVGAERRAGAA